MECCAVSKCYAHCVLGEIDIKNMEGLEGVKASSEEERMIKSTCSAATGPWRG